MLEKNYYYPGQESGEEHRLFLRRHWVAYAKWIIILLLLFIAPIILVVIGFNFGIVNFQSEYRRTFVVIGAIYTMFLLALFITTWIDHYLDVTIVTKKNLINIKQNELFSRSIAEQSLLRVQDVTVKKNGFLQSYFNFGTVFVETAGEQPNFRMTNIEDPVVVAETIMRLHEELLLGAGNFNDDFPNLKRNKSKNKKEQNEIDIPKEDMKDICENIKSADDKTNNNNHIDKEDFDNDHKIITLQTPKSNNKKKDKYNERKVYDKKQEKQKAALEISQHSIGDKAKQEEYNFPTDTKETLDKNFNINSIQQKNTDIGTDVDVVEGELKEGEEIQL